MPMGGLGIRVDDGEVVVRQVCYCNFWNKAPVSRISSSAQTNLQVEAQSYVRSRSGSIGGVCYRMITSDGWDRS